MDHTPLFRLIHQFVLFKSSGTNALGMIGQLQIPAMMHFTYALVCKLIFAPMNTIVGFTVENAHADDPVPVLF